MRNETIVGKVNHLLEIEGDITLPQLLGKYSQAPACIGVCADPSCDFVKIVKHNEERGYCIACEEFTVVSLFKLLENGNGS